MEKIIIFGKGQYFKYKINILKKYNVICILDNAVQPNESMTLENTNIRIIHPSLIDIGAEERIFLMALGFVSMWKQLIELGVDPKRIVYPFYEEPFFQSDTVLNEMVSDIKFDRKKFTVINKDGTIKDIFSNELWKEYLRKIYKEKHSLISAISKMKTDPISVQFGTERGTPVDRIYINSFLSTWREYISGNVLEIEDNTYTMRYGKNIKTSIIIDVSSTSSNVDFNVNIETGEGIKESVADCFILTQTLMYIFDLKSAAHNIIRMLKPGGVALITCSGISQNSRRCMENYGAYFNFNSAVFDKLFENESAEIIASGSYGNVKTVIAHLSGLCAEDLSHEDFEIDDKCYPLVVYAVVKRNE